MKDTAVKPSPLRSPADGADLIVAVLLGDASINEAATRFGVPRGRVLGWCERVKAGLTDSCVAPPRWRPQIGRMEISHLVSQHGSLQPGTDVTFTLSITNHTRADLFGITVIQRSFTNASLDELCHTTPMQPLSDPDKPLEPGHTIQYESTYRIDEADLAETGVIINAVAVQAFTAAGARFYAEEDASLTVPDNLWKDSGLFRAADAIPPPTSDQWAPEIPRPRPQP